MRGKVAHGLIPPRWDHPRLCGEKGHDPPHGKGLSGSPPPMRGKVSSRIDEVYNVRITPAYAGKSGDEILFTIESQDHPRLCGEKR